MFKLNLLSPYFTSLAFHLVSYQSNTLYHVNQIFVFHDKNGCTLKDISLSQLIFPSCQKKNKIKKVKLFQSKPLILRIFYIPGHVLGSFSNSWFGIQIKNLIKKCKHYNVFKNEG